ncbi:MAG TPA: anti-sigma factor domain-containing protein [Bacillota bacterium]
MTADRGVVLEVAGRKAVLLTPGGRFVRVRVPEAGWSVGQEVTFGEAEVTVSGAVREQERPRMGLGAVPARRPAFAWTRLRLVAAAAVLALVLMAPGAFIYANRPLPALAYVSVDINPGMDLGVDARGGVVSAAPTNDDGAAVLAQTSVVRMRLDEALKKLAEAAIKAGFMTDQNNLVIVAAVPVKPGAALPQSFNKALEEAAAGAESFLSQKELGVVVQTIVTDEATRELAKEQGLSVGKYAIYLVASDAGLPLKVYDLEKGVGRAIREAGGQVGEIVGRAHTEKDFNKLSEKYKGKLEKEKKERDSERAETGGQGSGGQGSGGQNGAGVMSTEGQGKDSKPGDDVQQAGDKGAGTKDDTGKDGNGGNDREKPGGQGSDDKGTGTASPGDSSRAGPGTGSGQLEPGQGAALTASPGSIAENSRPNEPKGSFGSSILEKGWDGGRPAQSDSGDKGKGHKHEVKMH